MRNLTVRPNAAASHPADPGWQNMVVRTHAYRSRNPEHVGPLSIKCAFNGEEMYEVRGARYTVDDDHYLLLNGGQRYASTIDSPTKVESLCIFFRPGLIEEILTVLLTPADTLLEDPAHRFEQPVQFFQQLYPRDEALWPVIERMRSFLDNPLLTRGWFDDQFIVLLERLLDVHRDVFRQAEVLPAVRESTRAELYQRLARARDFIDASYAEPIDMAQAADVACLSYYHFLRLFRQAFGATPHKHLTRRRLARARHLLATTDRSITQICGEVGFESLGSFSWLFRRHIGISPEHYRRGLRADR